MDDSPVKRIGLIVLVILAVGVAVWSAMRFTRGPQDYDTRTQQQIIDQARQHRQGTVR
jgi:hypothetical protein